MNINWRIAALSATLTALVLAGPATARANDLSYSDLVSRIEALESGIQSQQVQLASCDSCCEASCGCDNGGCGCGTGCGTGCGCCCTPPWYFGYEATVLRPYLSDANFGTWFDEDQYGFGHRVVLGYDCGCGLGIRTRYWFYNHAQDLDPNVGNVAYDMDVWDIEMVLSERIRRWNLMLTGGVRYGRMGLAGAIGDADGFFFEGAGPTVSIEANRNIGRRNRGFYLLGNFRASVLFGDLNDYFALGKITDESVTVLENQLGVGWRHCMGCGAILDLRTFWETQYWLNATLADSFNGIGSNVGFMGPSTSIGIWF